MHYVRKTITPLNLRKKIQRTGKLRCEILLIIIGMFAKMQHFQS